MSPLLHAASPETLRTCEPCRYGFSHLVRIPNSKRFLVIGPHWLGVLTTLVIISVATFMNLRYVSDNIHLSYIMAGVLYTSIGVLFVLSNGFLLLTALSDPGIVFKAHESEPLHSDPSAFYCTECQMAEPAGIKMDHCYLCGYCIQDMDHHCPWMGQCIGKKNMRWFIYFNISWVLFFMEFMFAVITFKW